MKRARAFVHLLLVCFQSTFGYWFFLLYSVCCLLPSHYGSTFTGGSASATSFRVVHTHALNTLAVSVSNGQQWDDLWYDVLFLC